MPGAPFYFAPGRGMFVGVLTSSDYQSVVQVFVNEAGTILANNISVADARSAIGMVLRNDSLRAEFEASIAGK